MPLRRTLFRARVWRPTLVRAGLLGSITEINSTVGGRNHYRATWTTNTGDTVSETFRTYSRRLSR